MIIIPNSVRYDKTVTNGTLDVRSVCYTNVPGNWVHKERFLNTNELIYITHGVIHLRVNHSIFDLSENEYMIIPTYSRISGVRESSEACSFFSVSYSGTIDALYSENLEKHKVTGNLTFLNELLKKMMVLYNPKQTENPECDALLLTLAYELECAAKEMFDSGIQLQQVLDYIHNHIDHELNVVTLCKQFSYSPDYVSRLFRQRYGITIKKYINQVRTNTAKQLLATSHLTIAQVSKALGFDDVHSFYKYFYYHESVTPSRYRKLH